MSERSDLVDSILLCSESDSGTFLRRFQIVEQLSKGGASAVCYTAKYKNGCVGILKEFYPLQLASLHRDADGQLVRDPACKEENETYEKLLLAYIKPYQMMIEARSKTELATFIPPFEIYYGCNKEKERIGTVYIWSPATKLETFDALCHEIHEHPTERPVTRLLQVLYAIESLTECVCALHTANLLHCDIKPKNFGFVKRGKEILTESISLFDVDTVCSVYEPPTRAVRGTDGYTEPEFQYMTSNNLTDIYAIGATLFTAIIVSDTAKQNEYRYHNRFFHHLAQMVEESKLIQASEINSHPQLRHILTQILKKTLCPRANRYRSCEALLADIKKALYYIIPAELASKNTDDWRWIFADRKMLKKLDKGRAKSTSLVLQHHLYKHPLYTAADDTLSVLLIGLGQCGQCFLDLALQIAQMPHMRLEVTVISASENDRTLYLEERPSLAEFFNVDGSLQDDPEYYGSIRFVTQPVSADNAEENRLLLSQLYPAGTKQPNYVFVAVGHDRTNLGIARTLEVGCDISIAWEGNRLAPTETAGVIPVYLSDHMAKSQFYAEMERMAFNTHLSWNRNTDISYDELRESYRKPYNHDSSVGFVLALKYKLYGIGIDMAQCSPTEAAETYLKKLEADTSLADTLVYLEHRRWNTEKICLGYTRLTDLDKCVSGKNKDELHKQHVCIARSRPERRLSVAEWATHAGRKPNKKTWDKPTEAQLRQLDELDRLSVELHLVYMRHAAMERKRNLLHGEIVAVIRNQLKSNGKCMVAFQELLTCMKDIWQKDSAQCNRYQSLKDRLAKLLKESDVFSDRDRRMIKNLLNALYERFFPVFASQQYVAYKDKDYDLVTNIPFILTYSHSLCLCIPFATGTNTAIFSNLAAPTVMNPARILYVTYCSCTQDLYDIKAAVPSICEYMQKKQLRAKVDFIIGFESSVSFGNTEAVEKDFYYIGADRIHKVKCIVTADLAEFIAPLHEELQRRSLQSDYFMLEDNYNTRIAAAMDVGGLFKAFPSYRYDSATMECKPLHQCDAVKYLPAKACITVTDMFAFRMSSSETSNKPEFYDDYKALWSKYSQYTSTWKAVCKTCRTHADKFDRIAIFFKGERPKQNNEAYRYIVPFDCRKTIAVILQALIDEKLIGAESCINSLTTYSCEVIIHDLWDNRQRYDNLFAKLQMLMHSEYIQCSVDDKNHVVRVYYNQLNVRDMDCSYLTKEGYDLLSYFGEIGYLINLNVNVETAKAGFTYATSQIKDLLTVEGRMLEVYVYHKAKETGLFDDIRSSFEIEWSQTRAENEFDCVLTKRFSSLFVECKATKDIQTSYYTKLATLVRHFGINATAILIADTQDTEETAAANEKQRRHGEELGVKTISDRADIGNIGYVLVGMLSSKENDKK